MNQVIRTSAGDVANIYMIGPFSHYTPEEEFTIDLLTGTIIPEREGEDVERYYKGISRWFQEVLPREGLSPDLIDKAILKINP